MNTLSNFSQQEIRDFFQRMIGATIEYVRWLPSDNSLLIAISYYTDEGQITTSGFVEIIQDKYRMYRETAKTKEEIEELIKKWKDNDSIKIS